MSYETVADGNATYAPTKWVRYTLPEEREIKDTEHHLKKDESVEGWYLKSEEREGNYGLKWNHTLVDKDGVHWNIPDNKDVNTAFLSDRIIKGAKTRFTYLGKNTFTTKTGQSAKAVKCLLEQDRTNIVNFSGPKGCEVIDDGLNDMKAAKVSPKPEINADTVPF